MILDPHDEEPVFPEEQGGGRRPLDFYGQTIPPLTRELRRQLAGHFRRQGLDPAWYVPRPLNAAPYHNFENARSPAEIPCLLTYPGPRQLTQSHYLRQWRFAFAPLPTPGLRADLQGLGLEDPEGLFHVYACASWVILADLERLGDRPLPRSWEDLLHPRFRGDLIINGEGESINPLLLGNLAHDFGSTALRQLGRNIRAIQSGGEMGRFAGSRRPERAALYVMPRFWAENNIHRDRVQMIWPEDGAYVAPLLALGQRQLTPGAQAALAFLLGPQWTDQLEAIHCIATHPQHARAPLPGPVRWIGWAQARNPHLPQLMEAARQACAAGY